MFITHPPRQTRHKRLVSARSGCPYADTPRAHGHARNERGASTRRSGTHGGRYSRRGGASLAPIGRGLERFSRHAFLGVFGVLGTVWAEMGTQTGGL